MDFHFNVTEKQFHLTTGQDLLFCVILNCWISFLKRAAEKVKQQLLKKDGNFTEIYPIK